MIEYESKRNFSFCELSMSASAMCFADCEKKYAAHVANTPECTGLHELQSQERIATHMIFVDEGCCWKVAIAKKQSSEMITYLNIFGNE